MASGLSISAFSPASTTGGVTSCQRRPPSWLVNSSVNPFWWFHSSAMAQPSEGVANWTY